MCQDAVHICSSVDSMPMQGKGTKDQQCLGIPGFDLCPEDSAPQWHQVSELWQPCSEDTRQKGCQEIRMCSPASAVTTETLSQEELRAELVEADV